MAMSQRNSFPEADDTRDTRPRENVLTGHAEPSGGFSITWPVTHPLGTSGIY